MEQAYIQNLLNLLHINLQPTFLSPTSICVAPVMVSSRSWAFSSEFISRSSRVCPMEVSNSSGWSADCLVILPLQNCGIWKRYYPCTSCFAYFYISNNNIIEQVNKTILRSTCYQQKKSIQIPLINPEVYTPIQKQIQTWIKISINLYIQSCCIIQAPFYTAKFHPLIIKVS